MSESNENAKVTRRDVLGNAIRGAGLLVLGGAAGGVIASAHGDDKVWQIDPTLCNECGNCATYCVLEESAVKCFHKYDICGRCDLCNGYYAGKGMDSNTGAEYQLCPSDAIERVPIDGLNYQYFDYHIKEELCIGCGKCVTGCRTQNGSLYLQVMHDRCLNCNECSIAAACPADAFKRVPAHTPHFLKTEKEDGHWG